MVPSRISMARRTISLESQAPVSTERRWGSSASLISQVAEFHSADVAMATTFGGPLLESMVVHAEEDFAPASR